MRLAAKTPLPMPAQAPPPPPARHPRISRGRSPGARCAPQRRPASDPACAQMREGNGSPGCQSPPVGPPGLPLGPRPPTQTEGVQAESGGASGRRIDNTPQVTPERPPMLQSNLQPAERAVGPPDGERHLRKHNRRHRVANDPSRDAPREQGLRMRPMQRQHDKRVVTAAMPWAKRKQGEPSGGRPTTSNT